MGNLLSYNDNDDTNHKLHIIQTNLERIYGECNQLNKLDIQSAHIYTKINKYFQEITNMYTNDHKLNEKKLFCIMLIEKSIEIILRFCESEINSTFNEGMNIPLLDLEKYYEIVSQFNKVNNVLVQIPRINRNIAVKIENCMHYMYKYSTNIQQKKVYGDMVNLKTDFQKLAQSSTFTDYETSCNVRDVIKRMLKYLINIYFIDQNYSEEQKCLIRIVNQFQEDFLSDLNSLPLIEICEQEINLIKEKTIFVQGNKNKQFYERHISDLFKIGQSVKTHNIKNKTLKQRQSNCINSTNEVRHYLIDKDSSQKEKLDMFNKDLVKMKQELKNTNINTEGFTLFKEKIQDFLNKVDKSINRINDYITVCEKKYLIREARLIMKNLKEKQTVSLCSQKLSEMEIYLQDLKNVQQMNEIEEELQKHINQIKTTVSNAFSFTHFEEKIVDFLNKLDKIIIRPDDHIIFIKKIYIIKKTHLVMDYLRKKQALEMLSQKLSEISLQDVKNIEQINKLEEELQVLINNHENQQLCEKKKKLLWSVQSMKYQIEFIANKFKTAQVDIFIEDLTKMVQEIKNTDIDTKSFTHFEEKIEVFLVKLDKIIIRPDDLIMVNEKNNFIKEGHSTKDNLKEKHNFCLYSQKLSEISFSLQDVKNIEQINKIEEELEKHILQIKKIKNQQLHKKILRNAQSINQQIEIKDDHFKTTKQSEDEDIILNKKLFILNKDLGKIEEEIKITDIEKISTHFEEKIKDFFIKLDKIIIRSDDLIMVTKKYNLIKEAHIIRDYLIEKQDLFLYSQNLSEIGVSLKDVKNIEQINKIEEELQKHVLQIKELKNQQLCEEKKKILRRAESIKQQIEITVNQFKTTKRSKDEDIIAKEKLCVLKKDLDKIEEEIKITDIDTKISTHFEDKIKDFLIKLDKIIIRTDDLIMITKKNNLIKEAHLIRDYLKEKQDLCLYSQQLSEIAITLQDVKNMQIFSKIDEDLQRRIFQIKDLNNQRLYAEKKEILQNAKSLRIQIKSLVNDFNNKQ